MDLKRSLIGVVVVLAVVVGALALFGGKSLDTDDLESDLAGQVAPAVGVPEDAMEISCPEDVDVEAGVTFDCDVTYESDAGPAGGGAADQVRVELTDDDGTYSASLR